jgi:hypothetical protein
MGRAMLPTEQETKMEFIMVTRIANESRGQYRSRAWQFLADFRDTNTIINEVPIADGVLLTGLNKRAYVNLADAK